MKKKLVDFTAAPLTPINQIKGKNTDESHQKLTFKSMFVF